MVSEIVGHAMLESVYERNRDREEVVASLGKIEKEVSREFR